MIRKLSRDNTEINHTDWRIRILEIFYSRVSFVYVVQKSSTLCYVCGRKFSREFLFIFGDNGNVTAASPLAGNTTCLLTSVHNFMFT